MNKIYTIILVLFAVSCGIEDSYILTIKDQVELKFTIPKRISFKENNGENIDNQQCFIGQCYYDEEENIALNVYCSPITKDYKLSGFSGDAIVNGLELIDANEIKILNNVDETLDDMRFVSIDYSFEKQNRIYYAYKGMLRLNDEILMNYSFVKIGSYDERKDADAIFKSVIWDIH